MSKSITLTKTCCLHHRSSASHSLASSHISYSLSRNNFRIWGESSGQTTGGLNDSMLSLLSTTSADSNFDIPNFMSAGQILTPCAAPNSPILNNDDDDDELPIVCCLPGCGEDFQLSVPPNSPVLENQCASSAKNDSLASYADHISHLLNRNSSNSKVEAQNLGKERVETHDQSQFALAEGEIQQQVESLHETVSFVNRQSFQNEEEEEGVLVPHSDGNEVEMEPFPEFSQAEANCHFFTFHLNKSNFTIPVHPRDFDTNPLSFLRPLAHPRTHTRSRSSDDSSLFSYTPPTLPSSALNSPNEAPQQTEIETTPKREPSKRAKFGNFTNWATATPTKNPEKPAPFQSAKFGNFGKWYCGSSTVTPTKNQNLNPQGLDTDHHLHQFMGSSPPHFSDSPKYLPFSSPLQGSPTVRPSHFQNVLKKKKNDDSARRAEVRKDSFVDVTFPMADVGIEEGEGDETCRNVEGEATAAAADDTETDIFVLDDESRYSCSTDREGRRDKRKSVMRTTGWEGLGLMRG